MDQWFFGMFSTDRRFFRGMDIVVRDGDDQSICSLRMFVSRKWRSCFAMGPYQCGETGDGVYHIISVVMDSKARSLNCSLIFVLQGLQLDLEQNQANSHTSRSPTDFARIRHTWFMSHGFFVGAKWSRWFLQGSWHCRRTEEWAILFQCVFFLLLLDFFASQTHSSSGPGKTVRLRRGTSVELVT